MVKKTVTYVDYDGNSQTEEHYFNLSKAELMKLRVKMDGKYIDYIQTLVAEQKVEGLFDFFYNLILDAHGVKSDDGKRFVKSAESRAEFESSIAFSEILSEYLNQDPESMSAFTRAILPPDFQNIPIEGEVVMNGVYPTPLPSGN